LSLAGLAALTLASVPAQVNGSINGLRLLTVLPLERDGWAGVPGLAGHLAGGASAPRPVLRQVKYSLADADPQVSPSGTGLVVGRDIEPVVSRRGVMTPAGRAERLVTELGGGVVEMDLADPVTGLDLTGRFELTAAGLVLVTWAVTRPADPASTVDPASPADSAAPADPASATSSPSDVYDLSHLLAFMPVPPIATEVADFTGKWARERQIQGRELCHEVIDREVRRGRPGHDSPYLMMAGEAGFGFRHGQVWAMHVAWSGDQRWLAQRLPEGAAGAGAVLAGGELLRPGEVRLAAGQTYRAPTVLFAYSGTGMDGIGQRFHSHVRAGAAYPTGPRPLLLNTWEAVYFDHDMGRLSELVKRAAQVGVERVVLDDGWFRGRTSDKAALGDWQVDPETWPDGLDPLVKLVRQHNMSFGLWFEPEMVSPGSRLAQEHPDWILGPSDGDLPRSRHQWVLNIARPEAFAYILQSISALVGRYQVDYIKWDHNRDLLEAVGRQAADPDAGMGAGRNLERPAVHAQTVAFYALLDALRERFSHLEIESCAGGGGRIDLGVLARTQRVWTTDCNDPAERQPIVRASSLLVPPEMLGVHVGAARSHTTGRVTDLSFRLASALIGQAGIEWDLTACSPEELDQISRWAALYKEFRGLISAGQVVHADWPEAAVALDGVVLPDAAQGLFVWTRLTSSAGSMPGKIVFPGLDATVDYRIRPRYEVGRPLIQELMSAPWLTAAEAGGFDLPGSVLVRSGLALPMLAPLQALVLDVRRI
jgi:alpha-galactosidase